MRWNTKDALRRKGSRFNDSGIDFHPSYVRIVQHGRDSFFCVVDNVGLVSRSILQMHRLVYIIIHQPIILLRPIVSSIGSITYNCAKHLAYILSPLGGNSIHHVANSQTFTEAIKGERVEEDEELRSYDVTALFTSVLIDKALKVIQSRLEKDSSLKYRTRFSASQGIKLLEVCLRCTYFVHILPANSWSGDGVTCLSYCV